MKRFTTRKFARFSALLLMLLLLATLAGAPANRDILPVPKCDENDPECQIPPVQTCYSGMVCVCPLGFCELTGGPVCYEVVYWCW